MIKNFFVGIILIGLVSSGLTIAQPSSNEFEIVSSTIDSGGGTSEGAGFIITGTIGQHDASTEVSSGGEFILAGGFWAKTLDIIFKDSFENESN
jgi:hypothetical protein